MYRRYRKQYGKRYSYETTNIYAALTGGHVDLTEKYTIVPGVATYGKRKVKNFSMNIGMINITAPVLCALIYMPQGTGDPTLNTAANPQQGVTSAYEPNQNVITTFVLMPGQANATVKLSRLARNLDSSDSIMLIYRPYASSSAGHLVGSCSYAIKY